MNYETTLITTEGLGTELGSPPRKLFRCYLSANQRAQNGELSGLLHTRRYHSNTIRRRYLQTPPVGRKIILGVKFPLALPRLPLHYTESFQACSCFRFARLLQKQDVVRRQADRGAPAGGNRPHCTSVPLG